MMKKYLMTLAAVLCCAMTMAVFTACTDNIDNPTVPAEEPEAVDNGKWHVTEEIMDKSVRPGDDFFMYCVGGYWNNTVLDETNPRKLLFLQQIIDEMQKLEATLTLPSKEKTLADADKNDAAAIKAQKAVLQSAIDRVNALTTKEEAWKLMAELYMEGYRIPLQPVLFSKNGKMAVVLDFGSGCDFVKHQDWSKNSLPWQLANNPEVLARVEPLKDASTRGFDNDKWPMLVTFFNTLGIALDDAYAINDYPSAIDNGAEQQEKSMLYWQEKSVEEWKSSLTSAVEENAVFFDEEAAATFATTCKDAVNGFLNKNLWYELSRAFAKAYVTADLKQRMTEYAEELRQTFRERIRQSEWLSEGSKQNAIEKLNMMGFNIGAPDEWFEEGFADLSQEQTLLDDIRALRRAKMNLLRKLPGMPTQRASFHQAILELLPLTTVNACYMASGNYMNIMPAFMLAPTVDPQQNSAHNYANMMIWGHEITHGFDTRGSNYNKVGDLGSLWATEADSQEFQRRAQLLIDCYNAFDVMPFETGLKADGAYTVSENVADLGGFFLAYDSYIKYLDKQGFKGEQRRLQMQRFYEACGYIWGGKWTADYALKRTGDASRPEEQDVHSLFRERVNGIVSNTDDWYDLFDVKAGDKLYLAPEKRARIW